MKNIQQQFRDEHSGPEELINMPPEEYAAARDRYRTTGQSKNQFQD